MDNNTSYKTQAIDINLLSVLDITKEGKVVSVEKWVELWNLVFQHINKIDAFCVDMQSTLDNWHESEIALNKIIEDMQMKYDALSTGLTHYGETPPQNPHINFWIRRMNDISTHCFLTNEDVDSELSSTSENPVQNKVANAALNNKMDKNNPTGTGSFSLNRADGTTVGDYSFAEGNKTTALGYSSHAEGSGTKASGNASHAEGYSTTASGDNSHAEGSSTTASSYQSHAEGYATIASGDNSHAEGYATKASGYQSHAEGSNTKASYSNSHAEGSNTKALSDASHAEGSNTIALGFNAHAEGYGTEASGYQSHAEGDITTASGNNSHAEGSGTIASSYQSHAEGYGSQAKGIASHSEGYGTIATSKSQHVQGQYNIKNTNGDYADIVGNGTSDSNRSNASVVDWNGNAWYAGVVTSNGADYAEFFEWLDGNPNNEDRVGYLVALDGEKIRFANSEDEILGIVSANPAILGDNYECNWNGKYLTDEFGRILYDKVEEFIDIPKIDEETGETTIEKKSLGFFDHPRINPDYNPEQEYINRRDRAEWSMVGMLGKLLVRDDGTAQVNGYIDVGENGIATASVEKTNIRVLSRINDHIVKVLLK